jgi:hypothetical protein
LGSIGDDMAGKCLACGPTLSLCWYDKENERNIPEWLAFWNYKKETMH